MVRATRKVFACAAAAAALCSPKTTFVPGPLSRSRAMAAGATAGVIMAPAAFATCVGQPDGQQVDILYLHGFFTADPTSEEAYKQLEHTIEQRRAAGENIRLHAPAYHPDGDISKTQIEQLLVHLEDTAKKLPSGQFAACVGYSFGGFLAALFQSRCSSLIGRALLLAPAIDNFDRNFKHCSPDQWYMPPDYVEELSKLPARPPIKVPTVTVLGTLETDARGPAPWRIQEWAAAENFESCYIPSGIDHDMLPWLKGEEPAKDKDTWPPSFMSLISWTLERQHHNFAAMAA